MNPNHATSPTQVFKAQSELNPGDPTLDLLRRRKAEKRKDDEAQVDFGTSAQNEIRKHEHWKDEVMKERASLMRIKEARTLEGVLNLEMW